MVVNIGKDLYIDVDKISAITPNDIIVDGCKLNLWKEEMETIKKAFIWKHKDYMYNEKLKKIRWIRGK